MRESQARAVAETPDTALAVTLNTNDGWNLHPQGKHEIGRRLALLARQSVYHEKIVGRGPVFQSVKVDGAKLIVTFDTDGDGLSAGNNAVDGFAIAGDDGVYHTAAAVIDGDTVVLTCDEVPSPKTVRYAWAGVPNSTLTNRSGLPAAPFRTDTQPVSRNHGEPQRQLAGYVFKGRDYQATISGDGRFTSLIVRNQQLLSNAPGEWGGSSIGNRTLSKIRLVGPSTLLCENNETSFKIEFLDDGMRWTVVNSHPKDDVKLHVALSPPVAATAGDAGVIVLKRKGASVQVTGVDRTIHWSDPAADEGAVLETDVPVGKSRTIVMSFK